uniref:Ig-like domain-containing protein n=1 Tax=Erpetoichthys calabaricus TaxID=27687 RepID=A0A8C4TLF1_ERPCA
IRQFNKKKQTSHRFQVVSPSSTLRALVGEDVTLPASLSPAINAQGFEVRWFRDDFDSPVLLYHNLQIRPERQIQSYKGRTALFLEELASGNVSLRLQNVRASDRGLYRCFVDSVPWNEEANITLKVEGHFELPFFVFHSLTPLLPHQYRRSPPVACFNCEQKRN